MRRVVDIVEAVQEQQPVTEEELRLALLCVFYDGQADSRFMSDLASAGDAVGVPATMMAIAKEHYARRFRMLRADQATYLGKNWTPGTPENTRQRAQSKAILEGFFAKHPEYAAEAEKRIQEAEKAK